jgi:hypothetical protein
MQSNVFIAADYADALLTAKRAKNLVFFAVLMILLGELTLFFVARYTPVLSPIPANSIPSVKRQLLQYVIGLIDFLGLILPALLAMILGLILHILLRGRLLGTAAFTTAFLWCVVLILLLFPWQAFLNNPAINPDPAADALGLKIPGALYTWAEITHPIMGAKFQSSFDAFSVLHWSRYVAFPVLSLLILLRVQTKSGRGLRQALEPQAAVVRPERLPTPQL